MMGLTQTSVYSTLHSYSESFHMPYINLNFMPNQTASLKAPSTAPSNSNFHLNLRPFHAPALVDLIRHYGWIDIIYLYDSDEGTSMQKLFLEFRILSLINNMFIDIQKNMPLQHQIKENKKI